MWAALSAAFQKLGSRGSEQASDALGVNTLKMPLFFPTGITEWWKPPGGDENILLDIIFVHGITGSREGTWTADGAEQPWPELFLPEKIPNARILAFGYAVEIAQWSSMENRGRLADYGKALLNALTRLRAADGSSCRPLIFVTHSFGGLVCENCLLLSNNSTERLFQRIVASTVAITFFGTPHAGAEVLARLATQTAKAIGISKDINRDIESVLYIDSNHLATLQNSFQYMLRAREQHGRHQVKISTFYERKPVPGIGWVVRPNSANLPRYNSIPMNKDHISMTRFESPEDSDYLLVLRELCRWTVELQDTASARALPYRVLEGEPEPSRVAVRGANTTARKPESPKEIAASKLSNTLSLHFEPEIDDFMIKVATRLLGSDEATTFNFRDCASYSPTTKNPKKFYLSNGGCGWLMILGHFSAASLGSHSCRTTEPLCLVPWETGRFLASIPSTDIYRILASRRSSPQCCSWYWTVYHMHFYVYDRRRYQGAPVISVDYCGGSHKMDSTTVPSLAYANGIVGNSGLSAEPMFPLRFVCSLTGFETIQLPRVLAITELPRDHALLLDSQFQKAWCLWCTCTQLLSKLWDHDGAFECDNDQVPLKVRIDEHQEFVNTRRIDEKIDEAAIQINIYALEEGCLHYFIQHPELEFEKENLSRLLQAVEELSFRDNRRPKKEEAEAEAEAEIDKQTETWCALFGPETARWLFLALTLTLGKNLARAKSLSKDWEILREHANCWIA